MVEMPPMLFRNPLVLHLGFQFIDRLSQFRLDGAHREFQLGLRSPVDLFIQLLDLEPTSRCRLGIVPAPV